MSQGGSPKEMERDGVSGASLKTLWQQDLLNSTHYIPSLPWHFRTLDIKHLTVFPNPILDIFLNRDFAEPDGKIEFAEHKEEETASPFILKF